MNDYLVFLGKHTQIIRNVSSSLYVRYKIPHNLKKKITKIQKMWKYNSKKTAFKKLDFLQSERGMIREKMGQVEIEIGEILNKLI